MMNIANYFQETTGLDENEVAKILGVSINDLKMDLMGLKSLPFEKRIILESLYSYAKLAASKSTNSPTSGLESGKLKSLNALLKRNEEEQITLVKKISDIEHTYKQQLARASLLEYLTVDKRIASLEWSKALKVSLGKKSKPGFDKALHQDRIMLKTLKYERKLLEQELQELIGKTRNIG